MMGIDKSTRLELLTISLGSERRGRRTNHSGSMERVRVLDSTGAFVQIAPVSLRFRGLVCPESSPILHEGRAFSDVTAVVSHIIYSI